MKLTEQQRQGALYDAKLVIAQAPYDLTSESIARALIEAEADNTRMREALAFYTKAFVTSPTPGVPLSNCDDGRFARQALNNEGQKIEK